MFGSENDSRVLVAGASARQNARFLKASGFSVVAVDFFADRDTSHDAQCVKVESFEELANVAVAQNFDRWMMAGGLENHPTIIGRLNRIGPHLGSTADTISSSRDLHRINLVLKSDPRFCQMPHTVYRQPHDGRRVVVGRDNPITNCRWISKRTKSAAGLSIKSASLDMRLENGQMVQEFIEGDATGGLFISDGERCRLLNVFESLPAPHSEFQYGGSISTVTDDNTIQQMESTGQELARQLNLKGIFGIDFVVAPDAVLLLEINPRITASCELLPVSGKTIIDWHIDSCCGNLPASVDRFANQRKDQTHFSGKLICYSGAGRVIPVDDRLSDFLFDFNDGETSLADIPVSGAMLRPQAPVVSILSSGESPADVRRRLKQTSAIVQLHLGQQLSRHS